MMLQNGKWKIGPNIEATRTLIFLILARQDNPIMRFGGNGARDAKLIARQTLYDISM